jgi:hypothetical protein
MSRRERDRVSSAIVFMDLAFGEPAADREERRARWARRKGGRMKGK